MWRLALAALLLASCADDPAQLTLTDTTDATDTAQEDSLLADTSSTDSQGADSAEDSTTPEDMAGDMVVDTRVSQDTGSPGQDTHPGADTNPPPDTGNPCAGVRDRTASDSPPETANWRYGGGVGYPDRVARDPACMTVVANVAELESALSSASSGDILFVEGDAAIDMTGKSLCIPGGVWLVSDRGRNGSPGGLLYTRENVKVPILKPCGDDVRISGLRLLGADAGPCPSEYPNACTQPDRTGGQNCRDCTPATIGVQIRAHDRLEVDNCELAGWSYAAIWLTDSVDNHVHHNHIHHTQRQGLGYGVVLTRGGDGLVSTLVAWNRFDYNRHAIAGSGEPGQDYVARDNLVLEHSIGHVFDMHGENEGTNNGSAWAGGEMLIYRNTVLVPDRYALVVRGRPEHGSYLYDNCLARTDASASALQRFFTGNFYVDQSPSGPAANRYGQSASDCEQLRWCYAPSGEGPWTRRVATGAGLANLRFGDFDGDGQTDVFTTTGSKWRWSRSGNASWADLNTSSFTVERMGFGDFDGDGKTDVFAATGSEWRVSDGGSRPWRTLRAATDTLDTIAFGDFDGDGATDVFRTTGSEWQWSRSGTAAWARINTSGYGLANMGLGDFDGDGKTDVFITSGGEWRISSGAASGWTPINTSGTTLSALRFGDFNGDGKTDALRAGSDALWVSWGASSGWQRLRIDTRSPGELAVGDFDGDGTDDLFRTGCVY